MRLMSRNEMYSSLVRLLFIYGYPGMTRYYYLTIPRKACPPPSLLFYNDIIISNVKCYFITGGISKKYYMFNKEP